jgi:hypothetical protein
MPNPNRKSFLKQLPLAVRVPLWKLFRSNALLQNDIEGDIYSVDGTKVLDSAGSGAIVADITGDLTGNADTATLAATVTVVDSTDATSYIALFDSATGNMAIKTDAGLTYNSTTGEITATLIAGPLSGNVTGNVLADDTNPIITSNATPALSTIQSGKIDQEWAFALTGINQYGHEQDFDCSGTLTGNTSVVGLYMDVAGNVVNDGNTYNQSGGVFRSILTAGTYQYNNVVFAYTDMAAGTVTNNYGFEAQVFTTGGTATNSHGINLYVAEFGGVIGTGFGAKVTLEGDATTWYGYYADGSSIATGTNYGIYTTGFANDWLGGTLVSMPGGTLDLGVTGNTGQKGVLNVYGQGTVSDVGGTIIVHPSEDNLGSFLGFYMSVNALDCRLGPSTQQDSISYTAGGNGWHFTEGEVRVGADGTVRGQLQLFGQTLTTGGIMTIDTGAGATLTGWTFDANSEDLLIGPNTDTNMVTLAGATLQLQVTGTGGLDVTGPISFGTIAHGAVLTVNGTYEGETISRVIDTAAAVFSEGLYLAADGNYEHSDADAASTMPCTAIALEAYEAATAKLLLIRGMVCNTAWTWSAPGVLLYASTTAGAFTETAPAGSGDQVQVIGYALSADTIWFDPDLTMVEIA